MTQLENSINSFHLDAPSMYPTDRDQYYKQLTTRNHHFVSSEVQTKIRKLKVFVAGCGSTGGACIESLARLGVENFILADNGLYELNNLNRQHAFIENLGENKAEFHAKNLRGINPYASIRVHPEGVSHQNVKECCAWADIIIDAVDVTSRTGIQMKLTLHEEAKAQRKPVFTALDIGFCQWGQSFDYRKSELPTYGGKLEAARRAKHPMKALFSVVPLSAVPPHALQLIKDLLLNEDVPASQLGATSDLLSSIIVAAVIRFADSQEVVGGWNINLEYMAMPWNKRLATWYRGVRLRREVKQLLKTID